jgi:hypothetical protein
MRKRAGDNGDDTVTLDDMPVEMQDLVIKRMNVTDFLRLVQTSHSYAQYAYDEYYWRHFTLRDYPGLDLLPFFATSWRTFYLACRRLDCLLGRPTTAQTRASTECGALLCMSFFRHFYFLTFGQELTADTFAALPNVHDFQAVHYGEENANAGHWSYPFTAISFMYHTSHHHDELMVELLVNRIRTPEFQRTLVQQLEHMRDTVFDDPEGVTPLLLRVFLKHLNTPNLMTAWNLTSHRKASAVRQPLPLKCTFLTLVMFEPEAIAEYNDMVEKRYLRVEEDHERRVFTLVRHAEAFFFFQAIALHWKDIVELFKLFSTEARREEKLLLCESRI